MVIGKVTEGLTLTCSVALNNGTHRVLAKYNN